MDTIEDFKDWLQNQELSENTISTYAYAAREFIAEYGILNKKNLIAYKNWLIEEKAPKTANNRCIAINRYCLFMGKPELCLKTIKIHKATAIENVISRKQYEQLITGLKSNKDLRGYFLIKFLAKTGARVSEFVKFRKADLEKGYCEIWTKGKIRRINFPDALVEESKEFFDDTKGDYLFPNRYGGKLTTRGVSGIIKKMAVRYEIPSEVMYPHSFRHLFAIEFLKANKNIALLADLMGHENVDTTAIYLKLSEAEQRKQLNEATNW